MIPLPRDLNIYQTIKCNFKCSFCSRKYNPVPVVKDFDRDMVVEVLARFPIETCCIAGFGEPLCSETVFDVVRRLNEVSIFPSIITNGSLIMDRWEEISKARLLYVNISLNSPVRQRHAGLTGTGAFDNVIEGMENLVSLGKFPVTVSMVVFRNNYKEIPEFIKLVTSMGIKKAVLINSLPYNEKAVGGILTDKDKEIIEAFESMKTLPGAESISWPRLLKAAPDGICDSPWKSIGVDGNGNITGCRRVKGPCADNGNIIFDSHIWEERYITALRSDVKAGKGSCEKCFGNYRFI